MRETKQTLEILLAAFRRFDDENDLCRFDAFCEAALKVMEVLPDYEHMGVLKSIFREDVNTDGRTPDVCENDH